MSMAKLNAGKRSFKRAIYLFSVLAVGGILLIPTFKNGDHKLIVKFNGDPRQWTINKVVIRPQYISALILSEMELSMSSARSCSIG